MADNHVVYKNGAKEIAHLNGCSITFMAKPDHSWIGSLCHIHSSLWRGEESAFAGETAEFNGWLAGQIACLKELAVFLAPNVNSYKRYAAGSWAPTTLAWGRDNRTCGFRIVGHGPALRTETRIPGADANPYLAFAAIIAAGLHGIEQRARAAGRARGQRLRVRRRPLSALPARGDRGARGRLDGARGLRRRGGRPLPQLRAHRAASLRPGRHLLRAGAVLRAGLASVSSVMQAPIGPAATVELAAAVCATGGLGSLAASWTPVEELRRQVRALAGRRFASTWSSRSPRRSDSTCCARSRCPSSRFLGGFVPDLVERAHAAAAQVLVQAGSVEAARRAVAAGADAVIIQGIEAGGHVEGERPCSSCFPGHGLDIR